jgi:hypothetical protein
MIEGHGITFTKMTHDSRRYSLFSNAEVHFTGNFTLIPAFSYQLFEPSATEHVPVNTPEIWPHIYVLDSSEIMH